MMVPRKNCVATAHRKRKQWKGNEWYDEQRSEYKVGWKGTRSQPNRLLLNEWGQRNGK